MHLAKVELAKVDHSLQPAWPDGPEAVIVFRKASKACRDVLKHCERNALREYVDSYDKDWGRLKTIMAKLWQSMQSQDTKNMNLEKDLEEILSKLRQVGGSEEVKTRRLWAQDEGDEQ